MTPSPPTPAGPTVPLASAAPATAEAREVERSEPLGPTPAAAPTAEPGFAPGSSPRLGGPARRALPPRPTNTPPGAIPHRNGAPPHGNGAALHTNGGPPVGLHGHGGDDLGDRGATGPQLRRFIKSRAYVPMHELRRRFAINGGDDDVTGVEVDKHRVYVGLPTREGLLLGELLRGGDIGYELSMDPITPIVVGVYPMRPVTRS